MEQFGLEKQASDLLEYLYTRADKYDQTNNFYVTAKYMVSLMDTDLDKAERI